MCTDCGLRLSFGYQGFPHDATAVWGARLIWPNDMLWDRQSALTQIGHEADQDALQAWLNGGAIKTALERLGRSALPQDSADEQIVFEDDRGKIVGSPQRSFGYFYVAAWLKPAKEA